MSRFREDFQCATIRFAPGANTPRKSAGFLLRNGQAIEPAKGHSVTVVACRWDGIGARLASIVNAMGMARSLDCGFRFHWPRSIGFEEIHDCRQFFSEAFLGKFLLHESPGVDAVVDGNTPAQPKDHFMQIAARNGCITMELCFRAFSFNGETDAEAFGRFRGAFADIGWNPDIERLVAAIADRSSGNPYRAIHVRAGDIVTGDWRQFVPVEKYSPSWTIEATLEEWKHHDETVLIVSDNAGYLRFLVERYSFVQPAEQFYPDYGTLTNGQRDLADLLLLSGARTIMCPCLSAFSRTAVMLADKRPEIVTPANAFGQEQIRELATLKRRNHSGRAEIDPRADPFHALEARDACWALDVAGDSMTPESRIETADAAQRSDPDYVGARTRQAFHGIALRPTPILRVTQKGAAELAERSKWRHDDPMAEAEAARISLEIADIFSACERMGRLPMSLLALPARQRLRQRLAGIKRDLRRLAELRPYQIDIHEVWRSLKYQLQIAEWAVAGNSGSNQLRRAFLEEAIMPAMDLAEWRLDGHAILCKAGAFPSLLRNVDLGSIAITRALCRAYLSVRPGTPEYVKLEEIEISSSGLAWASVVVGRRHARIDVAVIEADTFPACTVITAGNGKKERNGEGFLLSFPVSVEAARLLAGSARL
jgi:hypothetical protein